MMHQYGSIIIRCTCITISYLARSDSCTDSMPRSFLLMAASSVLCMAGFMCLFSSSKRPAGFVGVIAVTPCTMCICFVKFKYVVPM